MEKGAEKIDIEKGASSSNSLFAIIVLFSE